MSYPLRIRQRFDRPHGSQTTLDFRFDPARNALTPLDSYTALLPAALERSFEELRPLFSAWESKAIPSI